MNVGERARLARLVNVASGSTVLQSFHGLAKLLVNRRGQGVVTSIMLRS